MLLRRPTLTQKIGLAIAFLALNLSACQSPSPTENNSTSSGTPKTTINLTGAGASFPEILYQRWFEEYHQQNPNVTVNYQAVGSAAGVQQVLIGTVDFGASDIAMTDEEIAQVEQGVVLLPLTAGSVAIAYNLPEVETLKLSRQVYLDIFLGKITRWNDPQIAAINPDVTLPDLAITVIYRSDGSGTTAIFTNHLSAISPEWQNQVGSGTSVPWPIGIGTKSNAGVSAQIQQAEGTIGYVEFSYAKELELPIAELENQAGNYVAPSVETAAIALETVEFSDDLRGFVTDPPGEEAYPLVTYSWLLAYKEYDDPVIAQTLKAVIEWAIADGQSYSEELGYVALPAEVVGKVQANLEQIQ